MPDYSQSKIYKILSDKECYIGSTTQTLKNRFSRHKSDKRLNNGSCSSKKMDLDKSIIILLQNYPCETVEELKSREQYWIDNNDCVNKLRSIPDTHDNQLMREKLRKREQRKFKSSWAFNNNVYGFRLCLLDIQQDVFH